MCGPRPGPGGPVAKTPGIADNATVRVRAAGPVETNACAGKRIGGCAGNYRHRRPIINRYDESC